jgi:hypothetical protein
VAVAASRTVPATDEVVPAVPASAWFVARVTVLTAPPVGSVTLAAPRVSLSFGVTVATPAVLTLPVADEGPEPVAAVVLLLPAPLGHDAAPAEEPADVDPE